MSNFRNLTCCVTSSLSIMGYHSCFSEHLSVNQLSYKTQNVYYKVRWNYFKLGQCRLLQSVMDSLTNCESLSLLQERHYLFLTATGITKCDHD